MSDPGWPLRTGRQDYGVEMRDERQMVDPTKELRAKEMNLLFWQLGAMGLAAPKAAMLYRPSTLTSERIKYGGFAWDVNEDVYRDVELSSIPYLAVTRNGVGDHTFTFDATVDGSGGNPEALVFEFGLAMANHRDPWSGVPAKATVEKVDASNWRVKTFTHTGTALDIEVMVVLF